MRSASVRLRTAAIILCLGPWLAGCGSGDDSSRLVDARVSPDGRSIAYAAGASGSLDLYVVDATGGRARLVAGSKQSEHAPLWSPDGTRLAYVVGDAQTSRGELWVVRADGGSRARLFDRPARDAEWSPDGRRLVFVATHDDDDELDSPGGTLHVVEADGTRLRLVAPDRRGDTPRWSPDGREIAFWAGRVVDDVTDRGDVYAVDVASGSVRRLTHKGDVGRQALQWVPGSSEILYTRELELLEDVVETVAADTGRIRRVRGATLLIGRPVVSPDGGWIAFDEVDAVTVWRLDGAERRVVDPEGLRGVMTWSPDGRLIAVETFAGIYDPIPTDVLLLGVYGARPRNVTHTRVASETLVGWVARRGVAVVRDERSLWVHDLRGRRRLVVRLDDAGAD